MGVSKVLKLEVDLEEVGVGPTLDLLNMHGMGDVVPVLGMERFHIEDLCCLRYLPLHLMDRC